MKYTSIQHHENGFNHQSDFEADSHRKAVDAFVAECHSNTTVWAHLFTEDGKHVATFKAESVIRMF